MSHAMSSCTFYLIKGVPAIASGSLVASSLLFIWSSARLNISPGDFSRFNFFWRSLPWRLTNAAMAVPTVYALYADEFVLCPDSAFVTHGVGTALALLSSWLFFCAAIEVRQLRHH